MKIRIISVNHEDLKDFESVQSFGHKIENGQKLRYSIRRKKINEFISKSDLSISIFDAVTPNKFKLKGRTFGGTGRNIVEYQNKEFEISDNSEFYIANILSHYEIWNINEDTLILEDDVILDRLELKNIENLIIHFKEINHPNKILYLQKSTPWHKSLFDKTFNLEKTNENFGRYLSGDLSGTSALFITKESKKIILDNLLPLCACDKYFHKLQSSGILQFYLPLNSSNMLKLDKNTTSL